MVDKSDKDPSLYTKSGSRKFQGVISSGHPFQKGVKKTEAEKQAMREGKARAKARRMIFDTMAEELAKLGASPIAARIAIDHAKDGDLHDLIELLKLLKVNESKLELAGSVEVQRVFVTAEDQQAMDEEIDRFIDG